MKVCILTTSFPRHQDDYAGVFVFEGAQGLVNQGIEVVVLAPHSPGMALREIRNGVVIRRFRYFFPTSLEKLAYGTGIIRNLKNNLFAWVNVPFFLVSFIINGWRLAKGADIVHAHWIFAGVVGLVVARLRGLPLVVTVHGSDARLAERGFWHGISRLVLKKAARIVTVSSFLKKKLMAQGINKGSIIIIPNLITNFSRLLAAPLTGQDAKRLIWIGRFIEGKRPQLMVKIFQKLHNLFPAIRLGMVGDGHERSKVETMIADNNLGEYIKLHGNIPPASTCQLITQADILVSTSEFEGFGLTVAEAMLAGRVVVALENGGIQDLIIDKVNGIIVPNDRDTEGSFVKALQSLLSDRSLREQFARKAKGKIKQLCSPENILLQVRSLYENLLLE